MDLKQKVQEFVEIAKACPENLREICFGLLENYLAGNLVRAKYEHFKGQIKTPEDFIRLAATKSLLTGQPYLVRTRDGQEMPLSTWLSNALLEHRNNEAK